MDDRYTDAFWKGVNERAYLELKHAREADALGEHQTASIARTPDVSISTFVRSFSENTCAGQFYRTQFGFLEDFVRPSNFYTNNRQFEKLDHQLRYDNTFANNFFGQLIRATGKKHKTTLRRLRNHDVPFIVEHLYNQTPTAPQLNAVTFAEFRTEYIPKIISDSSIPYSAKKRLTGLFPEHVSTKDLEEWGISFPVVDIVIPPQFYAKLWFSTWVRGTWTPSGIGGDNTLHITHLGLDMTHNPDWTVLQDRVPRITRDLITGLEDTLEYRGKLAFELDALMDPELARKHLYKTQKQREVERESEKMNLEEFCRKILNIQLGRARDASTLYRQVKTDLARINDDTMSHRKARQELYKHIYELTIKLHNNDVYGTHYSRIELANRKTYGAWCTSFGVDFEIVSSWKAAQDEKEEERRNGNPGGSLRLSAAGAARDQVRRGFRVAKGIPGRVGILNRYIDRLGMPNPEPDTGAYRLLFTLETQLNKQLDSLDEIFRQKTGGYTHPVEYLTNLDGDADAQFNPTLKNLIDKRLTIAAQLGIVQDRIQQIEGGYQMGSLANIAVSGNTFVHECLRDFIPHAYAELSGAYDEDRIINHLEQTLHTAQFDTIKQHQILHQLSEWLESFVKVFYYKEFETYVAGIVRPPPPAGGASATAALVSTAASLNISEEQAEEQEQSDQNILKTVQSLLEPQGSLAIAAHYIERANVEGGRPEQFDKFNTVVSQLQIVQETIQKEPRNQSLVLELVKDYLETKIQAHPKTIGTSVAKNRKEEGYVQLLERFIVQGSDSTQQYRSILQKAVESKKSQQNTHLPLMVEQIIPEPVSMIDLFEDQIAKATQSIQENMTKESALPDVGKLEAELDQERQRMKVLRTKRVEEEKIMAEKFRQSEMARVEQEGIAQQLLEKANMERIAAEELRIQQELTSAERIATEAAKVQDAQFQIEQQKIEFQKERLALQQKQTEYHSDSLSEASEIDVNEHEGWTPAEQDEQEDDASSVFSDFSLDLND